MAARDDPNWMSLMLKSSETGILDDEELKEARRAMGDDRFEQEFECSFEAAIQGAYYAAELKKVAADGRIGIVPYDPSVGVTTAWDLGIGDSTAIFFAQWVGQELSLIHISEPTRPY